MPSSQDIMMVPLVSSSVESMAPTFASTPSNYPSALQNIQFFIKSAQGLPEPSTADIRKRRIVRASCSSKKYEQYRTNSSRNYFWGDNTSQIGPVHGTDQIIFSVELYAPLQVVKRFANTVASSLPYTINTLLEMQAKAEYESISIPLQINKKCDNEEAFLLLHVKQPTATFISEQLQKELFAEKEEREGWLSGSSSTPTSGSEPSLTLQLDAGEAKRQEIVKGKQREV